MNEKVKEALKEGFNDLKLQGNELLSFDYSLGGEPSDPDQNGVRYMNFNNPAGVEKWQILSPWRNNADYGTIAINTMIHDDYATSLERGAGIRKRATKALLAEGIGFGEKVICLQNEKWKEHNIVGIKDKDLEVCQKETVNGEIGIVGRLYGKKWNPVTRRNENTHHGVHFSSQPGYLYKYQSRINGDEAAPNVELAYALSIHKAQGSSFDYTILVLMDESAKPSSFLSREMLYTALSKQREKIIIITNKEPEEILEYAKNSELRQRLTNLFTTSYSEDGGNHWHDDRLIHRAKDGGRLRSKSELVIYTMLLEAGLKPIYEKKLILDEGSVLPDFTIEAGGRTFYWEHLGMLGDAGYATHWEAKKKLYEDNGISEKTGTLIVSRDDPLKGSLDAMEISRLIENLKENL